MGKIFAIGGGSFQKEEYHWMEEMALASCGKENISVLFLPCASYDDQGYGKRMKNICAKWDAVLKFYAFFIQKSHTRDTYDDERSRCYLSWCRQYESIKG